MFLFCRTEDIQDEGEYMKLGKGEGARPGDQAGELGWGKGERGGSSSR